MSLVFDGSNIDVPRSQIERISTAHFETMYVEISETFVLFKFEEIFLFQMTEEQNQFLELRLLIKRNQKNTAVFSELLCEAKK